MACILEREIKLLPGIKLQFWKELRFDFEVWSASSGGKHVCGASRELLTLEGGG
jgi:hypothetical protein